MNTKQLYKITFTMSGFNRWYYPKTKVWIWASSEIAHRMNKTRNDISIPDIGKNHDLPM